MNEDNMERVVTDAPIVTMTESAMDKVKKLITEEGNPNLKLRLSVVGGGCSGFGYKFDFDEFPADDDNVIVCDDVTLLVDCMSLQYLVGADIDYEEKLEGSRFIVKNPNATASCGCGSSFTV